MVDYVQSEFMSSRALVAHMTVYIQCVLKNAQTLKQYSSNYKDLF